MKVRLEDGGSKLLLKGEVQTDTGAGEYPDIYRQFGDLIDKRRSLRRRRPAAACCRLSARSEAAARLSRFKCNGDATELSVPAVVRRMTDLMLDELDRLDQAFAGNRLLSTFAAEARGLIEPASTVVDLELDSLVLRRGEDVEVSLFPFGSTMISMSVELSDGRSVEVASIGREGAVGGIISCGHAPAFSTRRRAGRRPGSASAHPGPRRGQAAIDLRCEHFLPILRLSALPGDAVGRLQCVPFDRATRRALAAARPGPRRRQDRADPGSVRRAAWCPADVGQRGDPVVAGGRARRKQPRGRSSHRPRGPQALFLRMLPGDSKTISAR